MRAVLAAVVGGVALAAPPALLWEGKLSWALPAGPLSWEASLSWAWEGWGWRWEPKARFVDGVGRELEVRGAGRFGGLEAAQVLTFALQEGRLQGATLTGKGQILGVRGEALARWEEKGWGWGLRWAAPPDSLLQELRLRFNLKRFLDEVLEEDWSPSLSFAEAHLLFPSFCCGERIHGWILFTKEGWEQLGASVSLQLPGELGLILVPMVQLRASEKVRFFGPAFFHRPPPCLEVYLAPEWDPAGPALRGLKLHAWGLRCAFAGFTVRYISELEPIGLVKEPYRGALFLGWEGLGCCGPLRFSMNVYFGEQGLGGMEEVEVGAEVGLSFGTLTLAVQAGRGQARLALGGKAAF